MVVVGSAVEERRREGNTVPFATCQAWMRERAAAVLFRSFVVYLAPASKDHTVNSRGGDTERQRVAHLCPPLGIYLHIATLAGNPSAALLVSHRVMHPIVCNRAIPASRARALRLWQVPALVGTVVDPFAWPAARMPGG